MRIKKEIVCGLFFFFSFLSYIYYTFFLSLVRLYYSGHSIEQTVVICVGCIEDSRGELHIKLVKVEGSLNLRYSTEHQEIESFKVNPYMLNIVLNAETSLQ